jgi:hypothetical protein
MRVERTTGQLGTFGPFFGVEAYDADNSPPAIGLLGSLGVDATTGDVLYQFQDTGFFTETGTVVAFGSWRHYSIELNYAAHQYKVFLDNTLLATTGFVDHNIIPGGLNHFTDADIAAIAAAGDLASDSLTGTAYFDNFIVQVPEPSAWVLAAFAGLGLIVNAAARRRN